MRTAHQHPIPSIGLQRRPIWRYSQSHVAQPHSTSCVALSQELLSMPLVNSSLRETLAIWPSSLHESLRIEVNKNLSPRVLSLCRLAEKKHWIFQAIKAQSQILAYGKEAVCPVYPIMDHSTRLEHCSFLQTKPGRGHWGKLCSLLNKYDDRRHNKG